MEKASMKVKRLGRGLDALLADYGDEADESATLQQIGVTRLQPGKYQPRSQMDAESLNQLAESIRAQGLMQPILTRPLPTGNYEIIAGERRWRAAQLAGLKEIPAIVRAIPDENALAMSLIENIQREDLNPLEEAAGIQRLISEFGMTHELAGEAVGRSRSAITNLLRLLQMAQPVQEFLMQGKLDMGHARALAGLTNAQQIQFANQIVANELSVRQAERLVAQSQKTQTPTSRSPDRDLLRLQEQLSDALGTQVTINANKKGKGKLVIEYGSLDQLDGLIKRLS